MTSENVAERYGITRAQQDELAARSHKRAAAARATGRFNDEIVPVKTIWKDPKTVRLSEPSLLVGIELQHRFFTPSGEVLGIRTACMFSCLLAGCPHINASRYYC